MSNVLEIDFDKKMEIIISNENPVSLKDLSLLLVCTTAYLYISCRITACFFLSTTAVSRTTAVVLYILKFLRTS